MALVSYFLSLLIPMDFSQPWSLSNSGSSLIPFTMMFGILALDKRDWFSTIIFIAALLANVTFLTGVCCLLIKPKWVAVGFAIASLFLSLSLFVLFRGRPDHLYGCASYLMWEGSMLMLLLAAIGGVRNATSSLAITPPMPQIE
jgi:hypothetical protein